MGRIHAGVSRVSRHPDLPGRDDRQAGRDQPAGAHLMHNGTHVNAPIHLVQGGQGVGELSLDAFFGTGPVLDVPKGEWELEPADLEAAGEIRPGDMVMINTGWHRRYSDTWSTSATARAVRGGGPVAGGPAR